MRLPLVRFCALAASAAVLSACSNGASGLTTDPGMAPHVAAQSASVSHALRSHAVESPLIYVANGAVAKGAASICPAGSAGSVLTYDPDTPNDALYKLCGPNTSLTAGAASIAVDSNHRVYVAPYTESGGPTIYEYDSANGDLEPVLINNQCCGQEIHSLTVDKDNNLWFTTGTGQQWGASLIEYPHGATNVTTPTRDIIGLGNNMFICGGYGVALDSAGNIYLSQDAYGQTVNGIPYNAQIVELSPQSGLNGQSFAIMTRTIGTGYFRFPAQIAIDSKNRILVADPVVGEVVVFNSDGSLATILGGPNDPDAGLVHPYGVAVGPSGFIYVSDYGTNTISGFPATSHGNAGPSLTISTALLNSPMSISVH